MGRSLARNDSLAHAHYPGCMTGILHILDYHHWHVKRLLPLPHKKHRHHQRRNHSSKVTVETRDPDRALADGEEPEAESFLAKQREAKPVSKSRRKARSWILSFSLHSLLHRINPVHHFEPEAVIVPNESEEAKPGECVEFLEIFKENKDFFLKILQDPEACGDHVRGFKSSNIKVRLSKSKSFPVAKFSQARSSSASARPSSTSLEHKQNEVWFFLDGDKSSAKANGSKPDRGWNEAVVSRFRDMKRKIKHAIDERRTGEDPSDEVKERLEISIDLEDLSRRRRVQYSRAGRTSSLNESLDRYTQLFGDTLGRDAAKLGHSRSLKLSMTSEERAAPPVRKASRRNLSLSDLDSLASLFNVGPTETLRLGMSSLKPKASEGSRNFEDSDGNEIREQSSNEPGRGSGASLEEVVSRPSHEAETESCYSEGFESEVQPDMAKKKGDQVAESEDFLYVKQILEIFGEEEELTWHSLDQPLSPSLFKQLESYEEDEMASRNDEDEDEDHHQNDHQNHHQLLFDLVNETLGEMNERSYTYFPRAMGLSKGERLLEEVWKRTSSSLSLRPELDKSLDDVVARDLAKRDGRWMSLEWEREMVALEIEDLVFDELLDQALCCLG